jgi:hypothetical protein
MALGADPEKKTKELRAARPAPRLGAVLIAVAIITLIAFLPRRYHLLPNWLAYVTIGCLIVPMVIVSISGRSILSRGAERTSEFITVCSLLLFNSAGLAIAAYNLVENPGTMEPVPLFYTSVGIWVGNILIFTLLYWLIDGGGPDARLAHAAPYPDFDFPAMDEDAHVPPGWQPGIFDYLFLAFTTSTAFSPTEAMPLTARAKLLVMLQSMLSLTTIAIVAARTINILK